MVSSEEEEHLLRSVALQNAQSILAARRRAEQEIQHAKEALEAKTAELARSLAMMRATLESTTDGILVVDRADTVTDFNEQFLRLWRLPREALQPRDYRLVSRLVAPQLADPARFLARVDEVMRTAPLETYDLLELADGRVFERFSKRQRVDEHDVGRVWTLRDITERRRADEERSRVLEAERAIRVELERVGLMKDEFLATLSHELRTPLNAVLGWSELLLEPGTEEAELKQGLMTIARNARAQAKLIEDLLDMNRIISGKIRLDVQRTDLAAIVGAAVEAVRPSAEAKGVRLREIVNPMAGPLSGDPNRLQQVAWNLLSNAVKFTPRGGQIDVLLERVNAHAELTVRDSGVGIDTGFLPHVFERFRQADATLTRAAGGLGLGLSIAKQLVELHGGTIRVESPGPGQGARFMVSLPLPALREAPEHKPPSGVKARPGSLSEVDLSRLKVLVVDDEPDARELVKQVLSRSRALVVTAATADDGLELMRSERPDVLISDIGMPAKDGYQLMREIRVLPAPQGGRVPAIALTAFANPEDRSKALQAGYQAHLVKPIEPRELIATVLGLVGAR